MGNKLMYVVRIGDQDSKGYYSSKHPWQGVSFELAERMSHKVARLIRDKFKRKGIRLPATVVPVYPKQEKR